MVERNEASHGVPAQNCVQHDWEKLRYIENLMKELQATVPSIDIEMTRDLARAKIQDLESIKIEVNSYLHQASYSYQQARQLILEKLESTGNLQGVLIGQIDDYLNAFETQIAKCDAQFEKSRAALQQQIDGQADILQAKIAALQEQSRSIYGIVRTNLAPKTLQFELRDLEVFGLQPWHENVVPSISNPESFRFPS